MSKTHLDYEYPFPFVYLDFGKIFALTIVKYLSNYFFSDNHFKSQLNQPTHWGANFVKPIRWRLNARTSCPSANQVKLFSHPHPVPLSATSIGLLLWWWTTRFLVKRIEHYQPTWLEKDVRKQLLASSLSYKGQRPDCDFIRRKRIWATVGAIAIHLHKPTIWTSSALELTSFEFNCRCLASRSLLDESVPRHYNSSQSSHKCRLKANDLLSPLTFTARVNDPDVAESTAVPDLIIQSIANSILVCWLSPFIVKL